MKGYKPLVKQRTSLVRKTTTLGKRNHFNTYTIGQGGAGIGGTPTFYTFTNSGAPFVLGVNNWVNITVSAIPETVYSSGYLHSIKISFSQNPSVIDLDDLSFSLEDPSGLYSSDLINTGSGLTGRTLTNTAFVNGETTDITTGVSPYTGDWNPTEFGGDFDNFVGATMNGVWKLFIGNPTSGLTPTVTVNIELIFHV